MALTSTDKNQIGIIVRKEIKDFLSKTQFKNEIENLIDKQMKSGRKTRAEVVDIVSKVTLELYKTFWFRRSMWQQEIKRSSQKEKEAKSHIWQDPSFIIYQKVLLRYWICLKTKRIYQTGWRAT